MTIGAGRDASIAGAGSGGLNCGEIIESWLRQGASLSMTALMARAAVESSKTGDASVKLRGKLTSTVGAKPA